MKKLFIITISIMIILALSSSVMAKAVQLELAPAGVNEEGEGWGKVILNNPAGTVDLILLVNIKNAAPLTTYSVWIEHHSMPWEYIGDILTNKAGNGSFKLNFKDVVDTTLLITGIMVCLDFEGSYHYLTTEPGDIEIKLK